MDGLLVEVIEESLGSQAVAVAPVGATAIEVEDITDFPDEGGVVDVLGVRYPYAAVVPAAAILDPAGGMSGGGTIVLADDVTVTEQVDEDEPVLLVVGDAVASTAKAIVDIPAGESSGTPDGGDTLTIELTITQRLAFPVGQYEPPLPVTLAPDLSAIVGAPGTRPVIDGGLIDPDTLPDTGGGAPTEPPESSPGLIIRGTAEGLVVKTDAPIEPTTLLTYHIVSTVEDDGTGNPIPFEPTTANQIGPATRGTLILVTELPDGTRLDPTVTYYLRAVAFNEVDAAPPGDMASGSLDPDVIHNLVTGTIEAGFALVNAMQVGPITIHPDTGFTIPGPKGNTRFKTDGTAHVFKGTIETDDATINGGLTINGATNHVNGSVELAHVVLPPTAPPEATHGWAYADALPANSWSLTDSPDGGSWLTVDRSLNKIRRYHKGTLANAANYGPWEGSTGYGNTTLYGVAEHGGKYYAVARGVMRFGATGSLPNRVWLHKVTTAGVEEAAAVITSPDFSTGVPAVGTDGTHVLVAYVRADVANAITVQRRDPATLAYVSETTYTLTTHALTASTWMSGVGRDAIGPGGAVRTWVAVGGYFIILDDATLDTYASITRPENVRGAFWIGDRVRFMGYNTYRLYEFTQTWWPAVEARYTWFDSDNAAPGGQHETTVGPAVTLTPPALSRLIITTAEPDDNGNADDPDSVRIYLNGQRQPDLGPGVTEAAYAAITAGAAPPSANGFITASPNPGRFRSAAADGAGALIDLKGDGSWRLGSLTDVNTSDTAWTAVPYAAGYNTHTTTGPMQVKRVGKIVYLRGGVTDADNSLPATNAVIGTLPVGFRPDVQFVFLVPSQNPATVVARLFVNTDGTLQLITNGTIPYVSTTGTWPVAA